MEGNILNTTYKDLRNQINYIKKNGFPGLCNELNNIVGREVSISWKDTDNDISNTDKPDCGLVGEELIINLPYAGSGINLRMMFHLNEPWFPPDLIINDKKFMDHIDIKCLDEHVPCLNDWNPHSDDMVAQLLLQLHQIYKKYQLYELESEEVFQFEYQSLLHTLNIGEEDVEILISGQYTSSLSILVRLPLSLQDVPPILIDSNPGPAITLLHLILHKKDGSFDPKLYLSSRIEALIGRADSLSLPQVPPGSSLVDYVTTVLQQLEEKVKSAVVSFEKRKQFIAQFLCQFGQCVLEYDAEKFTKVAFMMEWNDFNFLAFVNIPQHFPQANPVIHLQSVYHNHNRHPVKKEIDDLNSFSNLSSEQSVKYIKESIFKHVQKFQTSSVKSSNNISIS